MLPGLQAAGVVEDLLVPFLGAPVVDACELLDAVEVDISGMAEKSFEVYGRMN
jgi:hypothetical protein